MRTGERDEHGMTIGDDQSMTGRTEHRTSRGRFAAGRANRLRSRHRTPGWPGPRRGPVRRCIGLALGLVLSGLFPAPTGAQVPPDERWRTLETEHFRVTYPDGLRAVAGRAADRAERAYARLAEAFTEPPGGTIDLILTDHEDTSNGFATVVPTNRITIYARPPVDVFGLDYFDDWLDLVIVHELAHVYHLDRSRGPSSILRKIFGRYPASFPFFPELSLPEWTIEGLATYYESELTDAGRVHGSYHDMVLRTAIGEGRFERVDQASGEGPEWPSGTRGYAYGSLFFEYLLDRYGPDGMGVFVDAVAGQWIPYRLNSAAKKAFGVSFSQAWSDWRDELLEEYETLERTLAKRGPLTGPRPLTTRGWLALNPRISPDGSTVAFAQADGRRDVQIHSVGLDGEGEGRKLARANGLATLSYAPDGALVFAQREFEGPYRTRNDLYELGADGRVRRITEGARVAHPDVAPDGASAVAVQDGEGTNRLVRVGLARGTVEPLGDFTPGVHWAYPRWSPDGRWIAASRWRPGARYDLVILDAEGRVVREVTNDRAVDTRASWSPDGRWLLWSSDRTGIPNVFAVSVDPETGTTGPVRQVTNAIHGFVHSEVDPGGRWIVLSAYHAHGWQIERIPFDSGSWMEPLPTHERFLGDGSGAADRFGDRVEGDERPYRALRSLLPRYWEPELGEPQTVAGREVLGRSYGVSTSGRDLVNRHSWAAILRLRPDEDRATWGASYAWSGLGNPTLGLAVNQVHDAQGRLIAEREDGGQDTLFVVERERSVTGSVAFERRRWRNVTTLTFAGSHVWEDRTLFDNRLAETDAYRLRRPERRLAEGSARLFFSNARVHPFSVSAEDGITAFARVRLRHDLTLADSLRGREGFDAGFREITGRVRLYKALGGPGYASHAVAFRMSGGVGFGPGADPFLLSLGGTSGQPESITGIGSFGGNPILFPLRGYPQGYRSGSSVWSASAEYRFPLAVGHRGVGLLPLYVDRISGSLFVDAGNAWGPEKGIEGFENPPEDVLASVGAELGTRLLPGFESLLTARLGLAVPLVDRDRLSSGATVYLRMGRSF